MQTKDQNNDKLVNISSSPRATRWSDTTDDNYAYLSFFGRAEYSYSDRYYADFSLRTDGSSRFGASNRWAGFWSVGFMWNLRNEKFMENSRRWLTLAQIAVSTGTSGNSEIPNYEHLALVTGGQNYFGNAGIAPTQPGNEELSWEKLWTPNVALHLGFWSRLNLDVEDDRHADGGSRILCRQRLRLPLEQRGRHGQPRRRAEPVGRRRRKQGLPVERERQRVLQQEQDHRTL